MKQELIKRQRFSKGGTSSVRKLKFKGKMKKYFFSNRSHCCLVRLRYGLTAD